jgi:hypothetical protein
MAGCGNSGCRAERIGRGIRKPTVDAILSYAGRSIGAGWVFGLNEALDQAGATMGPLLMALILYLHGGFHTGFAALLIPALLCLGTLFAARVLHPRPHELEQGNECTFATTKLTAAYWIYFAAGTLIATGVADFALIGFHFQRADAVPRDLIPVFYAIAMASGALASIPLGRLFDRFDAHVSLLAFVISASAAPLVFLGTFSFALIGMIFGDRHERTRRVVSSHAYRSHSSTKTERGLWLVRYWIRGRMVFRERDDGIPLRQITFGRRFFP